MDYDLWVVREGHGRFETPEREYRLQPGDSFLLRGGENYAGEADPRHPPVVTYIHFDYLDASGYPLRPFANVPPRYRCIANMHFFGALLDRVVAMYHREDGCDMARVWFAAVLDEIDRIDASSGQGGIRGEHARGVDEICDEMLAHPERDYSLATLAKRLHVTPHHFGRIFKRCRGVSPAEFAIRARIDKARQLLLHSSHPIGRIAELLGYCDVYHFSRQFRTRVGVSPRAFRQRPENAG